MPNRVLSTKINVSDSISKLSPMEEVVFLHLILSCDDYGRFYGDAGVLNGAMFPRRRFQQKAVENALQKLETEGMLRRYEHDGTVFLELTNWLKYQSPRAKSSKYPGPDDEGAEPFEAQEEEPKPVDEDETPVFVTLVLKSGEHSVTEAQVENYKKLYPELNVMQEFRKMSAWCEGNPGKRKMKTGIKSFITRWLNRAQSEHEQRNQGSFVPNHPIAEENADNPFR